MDKNLMNDMDKNLMDNLYVRYDDKFGVLSDDKDNTISHILGTDLTLVLNKENMEVYLLVPLTRNHKFEYKGNYIIVDGKRFTCFIMGFTKFLVARRIILLQW